MENVVLVIHLVIALCLIGIVLLQRSEGGGLGMGGGGGDVMSSRGAATALGKLTWILAAGFIITSITLTVIARQKASSGSVINDTVLEEVVDAPVTPTLPDGDSLLPPSATDAPVAPPRAD
ncbi:preprotein translocase subunit SecG [Celeribacter sp.]|uniref:preprotein translocase subunit SecG n=1 Tax=Celeribacter sp. TaxID=1890673 RepID=UPI003A93B398